MQTTAPSFRCHRYPATIIAHCVRLYCRFSLSYRDVEELMFERGIIVSYESIRRWCHKFGPFFAAEIRRQRPQLKDKWHLDEVFIKPSGRQAPTAPSSLRTLRPGRSLWASRHKGSRLVPQESTRWSLHYKVVCL